MGWINISGNNINANGSICIKDSKLKIKQVIYNDPATIVYFSDGSKSVVKRHDDDEFDEQIGFLMCIAKRLIGAEELHRALRNNVKNYE